MKIRYLADENLRRSIVLGVKRREPSVSFLGAHEAGTVAKDDLTVLQVATDQGRILVSHDLRTLPEHFRQFVACQSSPGVFLIPQYVPLSPAIEELLMLWVASEAEEWQNQVHYLPL